MVPVFWVRTLTNPIRGEINRTDMKIRHIVKPVNFIMIEKQGSTETVDGGIAPTLIEEAALLVEKVKVLAVGLGTPEPQITDLKV